MQAEMRDAEESNVGAKTGARNEWA